MNKGELRTAIIQDTHRPDLQTLIDRFIRQGEGMIRRQVTAYPQNAELIETNRVKEGIYTLPVGVQMIRTLYWTGLRTGIGLARVTPDVINNTAKEFDPSVYAQYSATTIDIRGIPPANSTFRLDYLGMPPPLVSDTDTNDLLRDHETLYMAGAKFYVYLHTQDRELAQDELDIFNGVAKTLNEQTDRALGGTEVAETYSFTNPSTY